MADFSPSRRESDHGLSRTAPRTDFWPFDKSYVRSRWTQVIAHAAIWNRRIVAPRPPPRTGLLIVGLASAALLAQVLVRHTRQLEPAALTVLEPGQHYGVPVRLNESCCDLTFDPGTRYVVIIGSLGASEQYFDIDCSSQKLTSAGPGPAESVFALDDSYRKPVNPDNHLIDSPAALQAIAPPTSGHDIVPVNFATPTGAAVSDALHKPALSGSRSFAPPRD